MEDPTFSVARAENVLFPLLSVLGMIANLIVITVILVTEKSRKNRTVANTFVLNLAIADIVFLIALPFYTPSLHENGYPYSEGMCKFLEALKHISYHASILFLTGMSIDRYVAIVHSLRSLEYRTQRNARIICIILWLISFVTSIPIICFSSLDVWMSNTTTNGVGTCRQMFPGYENKYASEEELLNELGMGMYEVGDIASGSDYGEMGDYNDTMNYEYTNDYNASTLELISSTRDKRCVDRGHANSVSFRAWEWSTFLVFFSFPVVIILFCYFKIWRATAIRKVRSRKAEGNQDQQGLHTSQPPKQSWSQIQSKVTIMVATLVSAFIISWMPFQIWIILTLSPGLKVSYAHQCDVINSVVVLLAWSNSVLNPILYSITSENFRKRAVMTVFYVRYGYRRTMRMSVTRSSRMGLGVRTEKTDLTPSLTPGSSSPKIGRKYGAQSPPNSPKEEPEILLH